MEQAVLNEMDLNEASGSMELSCIFDRYYKRVYNYICYRVNDKSDSEDLTSQVFEKVMLKIDTYSNLKAPFEVWLFSIARNVVNDFFRSKRKFWFLPIENFDHYASQISGPEENLLRNETHDKLQKALRILNEKERNIVALKFGANLKNTEIAELLDDTNGNVGVVLHRVMKKLKKELEGEL